MIPKIFPHPFLFAVNPARNDPCENLFVTGLPVAQGGTFHNGNLLGRHPGTLRPPEIDERGLRELFTYYGTAWEPMGSPKNIMEGFLLQVA